ncbi:MAG: hypothetical protein NVS4B8_21670 [Herpetosiphon sp.]
MKGTIMAILSLGAKLGIKAHQRILLVNAPPAWETRLEPLPESVTVDAVAEGLYDTIHLFVTTKSDLEQHVPAAIQVLKPDGNLWAAFPKGKAKREHGLTRDTGWEVMATSGLTGRVLIAIDDVWSAFRFARRPGRSDDDPVDRQYAGTKASLLPIYQRLTEAARLLGHDVALDAGQSYVAIKRQRQFAVIQPSSRTRVDLGLRLPHLSAAGRLQPARTVGGTHINLAVALASVDDIDHEVIGWLSTAYHAVK